VEEDKEEEANGGGKVDAMEEMTRKMANVEIQQKGVAAEEITAAEKMENGNVAIQQTGDKTVDGDDDDEDEDDDIVEDID